MGSFSWNRADNLTIYENIAEGDAFKLLIPTKFGGGFIRDNYQDYGDITDYNKQLDYDMYELLAFWNSDMILPDGERVISKLKYNGNFPLMKSKDQYTRSNRGIGIDIGCYDEQIDKLEYPLKLVSMEYAGTYEDCKNPSYGDPDQGFYHRIRERYTYIY